MIINKVNSDANAFTRGDETANPYTHKFFGSGNAIDQTLRIAIRPRLLLCGQGVANRLASLVTAVAATIFTDLPAENY